MKLVRYLKEAKILKAVKEKQSNGSYVKSFQLVDTYNVQINTLEDEISATIYGANIDKMLSIMDSLERLYMFFIAKVDNIQDNISLYYVQIDNVKYKIKSVKESGIIIERDGTIDSESSL